jgi:plastocyanin
MPGQRVAVGAVLLGVLALPAAAQAATSSVFMGTPPSAQKQFERTRSDVNAFFPTRVTIRTGDSVRFLPVGFHNVDLPARGTAVPLLTPTGQKAAATDAAGAPFWFQGLDVLGFNPALLASSFGKTIQYDGSTARNSGLPLAERPKPFTVRFRRAGTFTYFCDIHPGMKGTVKVVGRSRRADSTRSVARRSAAQVRAALKTARGLAARPVPAGEVRIGVAGAGGVERFAFSPEKATVAPGTVVKFSMWPGSREAHTATTGPGNPEKQATSYLGKLAASFQEPAISPLATYPSDPPPAGPAALSPTHHGNGFWGTGALDAAAATPLPADGSVRMSTPGTYAFYCLIHPFMAATITVK